MVLEKIFRNCQTRNKNWLWGFHRFLRNWPTRNKNCLWWPYLLMHRGEMSNHNRGHSIDASYQVSGHLAKQFQRRFKCKKLTDEGCKVMGKAHMVFWSVSLQVQINFIFTDNVHLLYLSCNVYKSKNNWKLPEYSRNNSRSKSFQWCPLSCLHLTVTISYHRYYMNLVQEKLYFGQWPYRTNIYPVNAIWLLKLKQCRIKHNMWYLSSKLSYCSNFISFGRKWGLMVWFTHQWFIYSNSSHVGWLMCHRIRLKDDLC